MKKIVLPIILAMCLLLSACGGNNGDAVPPPAAPQAFRAVLSVKGAGYVLQCEWEQPQPGNAVFRVTEPKSLAGLSLTFTGTDCRADYKGLTTGAKLPAQAFFVELMETLAISDGLTYTDRGGFVETCGRIRTGDFVVKQNEINGDYTGFVLPNGEAEVLSLAGI
ncbi:MAG: hypothetical protein LBJ12_09870 [Oscillospiraceae bacterium]|jgi:hypothetical protein|nr:hypothetical protein [Oscillospiraceae bacterium]